VPASTILLIATDLAAGEATAAILTGTGYTVTLTNDPDEGFPQVAQHQLVILDVTTGPKTTIEICREIRATPAMSAAESRPAMTASIVPLPTTARLARNSGHARRRIAARDVSGGDSRAVALMTGD
jgi:CheY-like chemotaxis protein